MGKLALVGWTLVVLAGAVCVAEYYSFDARQQAALDRLSAADAQQLQQVKAEAEARLKKALDDATATQQTLRAELDFQKMPELPLETVFRTGPVLYVESKASESFACKVRLLRPSTSASKEADFQINARAYRDLGAIGDWVFARGDKVEFVKPGFKPRALEAP